METYQLLPELSADDYQRLKESIVESGVQVPVAVDEHGTIIDGHNRVKIADSLGIEYPTVTHRGLSDADKTILAATLNLARRHMTDAQKVMLGRKLEPAIAERARERQGHGETAPGKNASGKFSGSVGEARDEVARTVGFGTGRTYENHKRTLEELEEQPDGPQLLTHLASGDWDISDARAELATRRKSQQHEQAEREQEQSDRYLEIAGDTEGRRAKARVRRQYTDVVSRIHSHLLPLDPEQVAASLTEQDAVMVPRFISGTRAWLDRIEAEMDQGIRVVHRKEAG